MGDRKVLLRDALPADARAVASVHVRAWQVGYRGLIAQEYLDALRPEDRASRYTFGSADPAHPTTIVATEAGVVRGFATVGGSRDVHDARTGELLACYVDPDAWRRGIGRLLETEARARLASLGFTSAVLWVLERNNRAQRFYRAVGWESDGVARTEECWGVLVNELRFRRALF
ncbi:MAG: GNAT family N-acetyltransferase [Gemmatimonadaceae bacterium]